MIEVAAALFVDIHEGLKEILSPYVGKLKRGDGSEEPAVVAQGSNVRLRLIKGEDVFVYLQVGDPTLRENGVVNITIMGVLHSLDPEDEAVSHSIEAFKELTRLGDFLSNWPVQNIEIKDKDPCPYQDEIRCPVTIELYIKDEDVLDMEGETFSDVAKSVL